MQLAPAGVAALAKGARLQAGQLERFLLKRGARDDRAALGAVLRGEGERQRARPAEHRERHAAGAPLRVKAVLLVHHAEERARLIDRLRGSEEEQRAGAQREVENLQRTRLRIAVE